MTPERHERIGKIFFAASQLTGAQREAYLAQVCAGDSKLREEVQSLLAADGDDVLGTRSVQSVRLHCNSQPSGSTLPERIGSYHIKRVIASGGMGTVYEATQDNPRRVVAVKVMKQGIASKSALRRFEYEGQILGRLRHPGIAQIYEAGTHDEGYGAVPYFAMEYISNAKPITKFADEKKLGTRQRMELFAKVCEAVHHGHQKGIIHRDLKPSNILVDSTGQVKIIDFGVARGTDSDLAVTMQQTDVGQLIGTLQYMSPEQCEGDPHDIDIRSDVYGLGVVFYELLCGRLPYDVTRVAIHQATRLIREQAPTKLSTLDKTLSGDVETIAQKALEKERERRYQSAAEFAQDIHRYLTGEAILARRASIIYQLRLFARRNKGVFSSLAAVFVVLLTGVIVTTSLYVAADRARAEQVRERQRAEALNNFLVNDMLASADPEIGQGPDMPVAEVLKQSAARIGSAFPNQPELEASIRGTIGKTYTQLGLFDQAEAQLEKAFEIRTSLLGSEHPETLRTACDRGELAWRRERHKVAAELLRETLAAQRRVLGSEHPDVIYTMLMLGHALNRKPTLGEAEALFTGALKLSRQILGPTHLVSLKLMNACGVVQFNQGELIQAQASLKTTLAMARSTLGNEHPFCSIAMYVLAKVASAQGDLLEAERQYEATLELQRRVLGPSHFRTVATRVELAPVLMANEKFDRAATLSEEAYAICLSDGADDSFEAMMAIKNLARVRVRQGNFRDASSLLSQAQQRIERSEEQSHSKVLSTKMQLLELRFLQGSLEEVADLGENIIDALPPVWWSTWRPEDEAVFRVPCLALYLLNRDDEAKKFIGNYLAWLRGFAEAQKPAPMSENNYAWAMCTFDPPSARNGAEAVRMAQRGVEATNARDPTVLDTLATAYALEGDLPKAVETQRKAVSLLPRRGRPANLHAHIQLALVSFLRRSGQPAEADSSKSELLARLCEGHPESKCRVMERLGKLVVLLFGNGQVYIGQWMAGVLTDISSGVFGNDKADLVPLPILYALRLESDIQYAASEAILRECLTIRQLMLGESDWRTAQAKSLVGNALLHLDRFDEAGHMLKESLEQLQSAEGTPAEELQKARSRLTQYESALAGQR